MCFCFCFFFFFFNDTATTEIYTLSLHDALPIFVLSDEIYGKILYDGTHETIATRPDVAERTILLDGFSKTYAMTGWRLGYGVMNATLAKHVARLATNVYSCATSFVQRAAPEALQGPQDEVRAMVAEFR